MSAFVPSAFPLRRSRFRTNRQTPRCSADTEAPPESRFANNYPAPRFETLYINLFTSSGSPLLNKIGVVREAVPLDLGQAASLLAELRASQAKKDGDFSVMFSGPTTDNFATDPVEKYYPSFRRDEAPIIEITPPSSDGVDGTVTIALGSVVSTPPPEEQLATLPDLKIGSPWQQGPSLSPPRVVDMFFGKEVRNLAPVIELLPGTLAVSVAMKEILGRPDPESYPKQASIMAPKIEIRKPLGDWDSSAFVQLSMEEVQLPVIEAAISNVSN